MTQNNTLQFAAQWNRPYLPTGGAEKVYLLIEAKGNGEVQVDRAPVNLSLVLDRSGSMTGEPLEYSKKACQFVIDQMTERDLLNMVAFDDEVQTIFEPQAVRHKDLMNQRIASIQTGGCTNLSGGLIQGAQYVKQMKKDGTVQRVILLSDGHANSGVTNPTKLSAIAREYQHGGIGISTIGLGDGFDEELMEGIADGGGGNFYFVEKPDDIPAIFAKELQGLLSVVAQNVKLRIQPSGNVEITRVFGYTPMEEEHEGNGAGSTGNPANAANRALTLNLGDLFNQEVKSILLELAFYPHIAGQHEALQLEWQYIDVTETAVECKVTHNVQAEFTNDINLLNEPLNSKVQKQVKITESAMVIEEAMKAFDGGDYEQGKQLLQEQADQMLAMAIQSDDAELREESAVLCQQLESFQEAPAAAYTPTMRKTLHEQKYRQMKRKRRSN
jgi:Ca-activated chloride channel family protein